MISARRAALQGLKVPLTAIMIAVLGLWPEPEDEVVVPPHDLRDPLGGAYSEEPSTKPAKATKATDDAKRKALMLIRRAKSNALAIMTAIAYAEEEYT